MSIDQLIVVGAVLVVVVVVVWALVVIGRRGAGQGADGSGAASRPPYQSSIDHGSLPPDVPPTHLHDPYARP
jgi:hypothetical protein